MVKSPQRITSSFHYPLEEYHHQSLCQPLLRCCTKNLKWTMPWRLDWLRRKWKMDVVVCAQGVLNVPMQQENRLLHSQQRRWRYYFDEPAEICPMDFSVPISVSKVPNSFKIEVQTLQFNILPPIDALSDFIDASSWENLSDSVDTCHQWSNYSTWSIRPPMQ